MPPNEDKALKVDTVKSHLLVQLDKFNGHDSMTISCAFNAVNCFRLLLTVSIMFDR